MQDSIVSRRGCKHGVYGGGVEEIELIEAVCDLYCLTRRSFDLHFAYPVLPGSSRARAGLPA
jgi:hypothetical protein